jgi:hypothetical protein
VYPADPAFPQPGNQPPRPDFYPYYAPPSRTERSRTPMFVGLGAIALVAGLVIGATGASVTHSLGHDRANRAALPL